MSIVTANNFKQIIGKEQTGQWIKVFCSHNSSLDTSDHKQIDLQQFIEGLMKDPSGLGHLESGTTYLSTSQYKNLEV